MDISIVFLALYPVIHALLVAGSVLLSLSAGFRRSTPKFPHREPPTSQQKLVWRISDILYWLLAAPLLLLEKATHTRLTTLSLSGFIFMLLNGFLYGVVILWFWRGY